MSSSVLIVEKTLTHSGKLGQNAVRVWRFVFCRQQASSAETFFVQKVTGSQKASCRDEFSWSSINSVCRESALTLWLILCASIEYFVTFLTRNGFSVYSRSCFPMLRSSRWMCEFCISPSRNSAGSDGDFFQLVCSINLGKCNVSYCMSSCNTKSFLWEAHTADMRSLIVSALNLNIKVFEVGCNIFHKRNNFHFHSTLQGVVCDAAVQMRPSNSSQVSSQLPLLSTFHPDPHTQLFGGLCSDTSDQGARF